MTNRTAGYQEAPDPDDLEGWRQAIAQGRLPTFRLEAITAALQDLGPLADHKVRNPLANHLSNAMVHLLRKLVGTNHPNRGEDIIYRVHCQLFVALLTPGCKDGKALRETFGSVVSFRIKDAIANEKKHSQIPIEAKFKATVKGLAVEEIVTIVPAQERGEPANDTGLSNLTSSPEPTRPANDLKDDEVGFDVDLGAAETDFGADDDSFRSSVQRDPTLLDGVRALDQQLDIAHFLAVVPDVRKRLAFYLYMDDVPFRSTRGASIAKALGVSGKTAKQWVEEVRATLQLSPEVQELRKANLGDRT